MHRVKGAMLNISLDFRTDEKKNCRPITLNEIQMPVQETTRSNKNAQYWLICQTLTMHWMSRGVSSSTMQLKQLYEL